MEFIKTYFAAEKVGALLFLCVGLIALLFSTLAVWKWNDSMLKGMAIPIFALGIIQIVVGAVVYFRTDEQLAQLQELFMRDQNIFLQDEGKRMATVMLNFSYFKIAEIAMIVSGLLMVVFLKTHGLWMGVALGLLLQGSLMLAGDIFAEKRGDNYRQAIENLHSAEPFSPLGPF